MTAYWEIVALSAYDMFSKYKYLNVNLVLFTPRFGVRIYFLVPFTDHCLIFFFSSSSDDVSLDSQYHVWQPRWCLGIVGYYIFGGKRPDHK